MKLSKNVSKYFKDSDDVRWLVSGVVLLLIPLFALSVYLKPGAINMSHVTVYMLEFITAVFFVVLVKEFILCALWLGVWKRFKTLYLIACIPLSPLIMAVTVFEATVISSTVILSFLLMHAFGLYGVLSVGAHIAAILIIGAVIKNTFKVLYDYFLLWKLS